MTIYITSFSHFAGIAMYKNNQRRAFRKHIRDFEGLIMHAYNNGQSYRKIQHQLKLRNLDVHHSTIYRFVKRQNQMK